MSADVEIQAFVESLVDEAWRNYPATGMCRLFGREKLSAIQMFQNADVVVALAKYLDRRDAHAVLLSVPEIWMDFGVVDWASIMRRLSPRPRLFFGDWSGAYLDIEFLSLYLRVNSIAIALSSSAELSHADRICICKFCRDAAESLCIDSESFVDFDGESLCSVVQLDHARDRLIDEWSELQPPYCDAASLRAYAESALDLC